MADDDVALLYAIILEQLSADNLLMVRDVLEDEYASQFGAQKASELESATATLAEKFHMDGTTTTGGKKKTSLQRLLSSFQNKDNTTVPSPPAPATRSPTRTPPIKLGVTTTSVSTPAPRLKVDLRSQQRVRRSSLAVSPSNVSRVPELPLLPRPAPDYYRDLEPIDDLALDEQGGMKGGSALCLLRWICRCGWIKKTATQLNLPDPELANVYDADVVAYLMTFTDFTTPEDLVNGLETVLVQYPQEAWGLQQFLIRWLEYDFDQVSFCVVVLLCCRVVVTC